MWGSHAPSDEPVHFWRGGGAVRASWRRAVAGVTAAVVAAAALTGCTLVPDDDPNTLTYWASNQATSVQADYEILRPELEKFRQRTGITVDLQVISWSDLLNRLLSATVSGTGPDVVNIGNTWSVSLQATGGLIPFEGEAAEAIGGLDKFLETSISASGAPGQVPTSVPLYGLAYGLFYNKQMFAEAGLQPPRTWAEFLTAAQRLTDPAADRWGVTLSGASYTENAHFAFIFGQQHGGDFFDAAGEPQFTQPTIVAAVKQYLDLLAVQGLASPSDAEQSTTQEAGAAFAAGKAGMFMAQNNAAATLEKNGMTPDEYGIAPMPILDPLPPGGRAINSHVAGINIAAMVDGDNHAGALELIEFLTGPEEQEILNEAFGSLPVLREDPGAAAPDPATELYRGVLAETAAPMPLITNEAEFESTVGNAMRDLFGRAATGEQIDEQAIRDALAGAETSLRGSTS
ncbi:sugar ABC transporter substrate-binding protein [Pseudonocardia sp. MH-G8]|nr:sugar ABC transporter substrate-binding protein [Pseudonocardia sp. MH-G8]